MKYNKPFISIQDQIKQLKKRGLIIKNESFAETFLSNVSYYRLAGYWWPMQSDKINHVFKSNSTFENVVAIYNFDRELKNLIFDVIERIEIGFRTKLVYHLSQEKTPWWFEDSSYFNNQDEHQKALIQIDHNLKHTKEVFIIEHYIKYFTDKRRPPSWKTLEVVSFGVLSKL